jgi:hypothetical protein
MAAPVLWHSHLLWLDPSSWCSLREWLLISDGALPQDGSHGCIVTIITRGFIAMPRSQSMVLTVHLARSATLALST